jgi:hypothetical protein
MLPPTHLPIQLTNSPSSLINVCVLTADSNHSTTSRSNIAGSSSSNKKPKVESKPKGESKRKVEIKPKGSRKAGAYAAKQVELQRNPQGLPKRFFTRKFDVMYRVSLETFLCYRLTIAGYQTKAHITQSLDRLSAISFPHLETFVEHIAGEMKALGIKKRLVGN